MAYASTRSSLRWCSNCRNYRFSYTTSAAEVAEGICEVCAHELSELEGYPLRAGIQTLEEEMSIFFRFLRLRSPIIIPPILGDESTCLEEDDVAQSNRRNALGNINSGEEPLVEAREDEPFTEIDSSQSLNVSTADHLREAYLPSEGIKYLSHTCSICISDLENRSLAVSLPCLHIFERKCIKHWLEVADSCPLCRRKLNEEAD
ncbi:hypothetical protein KP509_37G024100 [Ceratopteris richardii]|uniref:RING-type E3 ubiquitin transferase n=1 Tax=Ceratopteris richardii TaxID=49495 RepID=A0A8T2Q8F1_CERRI|nr:hypothetical protein KP509_37G024100 [Ceratopteris richardii]